MERIEKALKDLAADLKSKGYNVAAFQTNSGFSDSLERSVSKYLHDSLLGKERGLRSGIVLSSYLKYEGEGRKMIRADMLTAYESGKFEIYQMNLVLSNSFSPVAKAELKDLTTASLPSRTQAILTVYNPLRSKKNKYRI